ncbi:AfsR/SARP family transcriptional regulator [Micromonospora sp. NBC_01796]|uniref:AfsR/SARP family transcriptional regulator n=1 Tax=Micromonospora sp. NBC_01796 TaxID=2975987 RepID=UPI002DD9532A|nr:tetratricopeptide repeat protein [Micromonospora sp. NBC_01796]WSA86440.1 tetratricopeptide repeat protein [Micromonospora sp. NBC_01796]
MDNLRSGAPVRLTVLGPVRLWRGGEEVQLGAPQVRALLAVLLARVGTPVSLAEIVDVLWGQDPPPTAVNAVHGHIGTLRRLLEPALGPREPGRWLGRSAGGYQLTGDADSVDLLDFRRLLGQARAAVAAGREGAAVPHFAAAVRLWQGPGAGNVNPAIRTHPVFGELDREYFDAVREAADCALGCGQADELVTDIRRAAERAVLDEPLQARLILLLVASGQQAQALAVFARVRAALAEELGIDPGAELRAAYETVLDRQRGNSVPEADRPTPTGPVVRPAQLPPDLSSFVGRRGELRRALALVPEQGTPSTAMVVSAISGMAGTGKTTIAVHWAHRVAPSYPDGQLYVNLRGFDPTGSVMSPAEALRGMLDALGVAPERSPRTVEGQTALYRSLLAGRRILVLLDNARDAEQVRPLLPGGPGCLAIVTSRNQLSGLVAADGAHPLVLDILPPTDARELLARRVGAARLNAEPEATGAILGRCGGLPLALAIVAARVATSPARSLAGIAAELHDEEGGLDGFADPDDVVDARAVFSWSYRALSADSARLFRLLGGTRTGPEISLPAAASLAGVPIRRARALLAELVRANLAVQPVPGRHTMHDLLAAYAGELAATSDDAGQRRAARHRLLDHYLHSALAADRLLSHHRPSPGPPAGAPGSSAVPQAQPGSAAEVPSDVDAAWAWFTTERSTLLAAVDRAAVDGFPHHAWQLTWAMVPFLHRRGYFDDWVSAQETARAALDPRTDRLGLAHTGSQLGLAYTELGRYDDARALLTRSVALFAELGDHTGQGDTYRRLGGIAYKEERYDDALAHTLAALDHYAAAGDRPGQAHALNGVGWVHVLRGDHHLAIDYCGRALVILREVGNRQGEAATRDSLGYAHHHLGEYAHAAECYREAIRIRRETGDRVYEANSLHRLGDNHLAAGEPDEAYAVWRQALDIMTEISHPDTEKVRAKLATRPE